MYLEGMQQDGVRVNITTLVEDKDILTANIYGILMNLR